MSLIETYYQRFNSADWEGMLALLDEAVVHEVSQGPVRHGKAIFRDFLKPRVSVPYNLQDWLAQVGSGQ